MVKYGFLRCITEEKQNEFLGIGSAVIEEEMKYGLGIKLEHIK
jgi:hypothetical protein